MSFPLVISFYTAGTPYEQEIETLIESCQRFNLETHIEGLDPVGSWVENCAMKGPFVLDCLQRFARPVLWLDADAEVVRYPALFDNADFDVAAYRNREGELLSGTAYFAASDEAIALAARWAERCQQDPHTWDQKHLRAAVNADSDATFKRLPQAYCKIFDRPWRHGEMRGDVIVHHQASRRFKAKINVNEEGPGD